MPDSKEDQSEEVAQKLAALTGETLTETIPTAVVERFDRLCRASSGRTVADELNDIALRSAARPVVCNLTADELLGYDED